MDGISAVASVLGILSFAVKSTKGFYEFTEDLLNAPDEITAISRDALAFHGNFVSLQTSLASKDAQQAIDSRPDLQHAFHELEEPMHNCSRVLERLKDEINPHTTLSRVSVQGKKRIRSSALKWWWKKREVMRFVDQFSWTKETLTVSLQGIIL